MIIKCIVSFLCLVLSVPAMSQGIAVRRKVFTATGSSEWLDLRNIPARRHVLQWWGAGTLSGCSIKVEQSSDGSTASDLIAAQTCTSNGVFRITTDTSVNWVRVTVTTLTGGGTITGRYDGYDPIVLNDAGAGGGGDALVADPLSQFASTNSTQLASVLSDETGSGGGFVRATSPVLTTPNIGSATGSVSGNAGTATALAANPTNCMAGNYPLGVDASGNSENCTPEGGGVSGLTAGRVPVAASATTLEDFDTFTYDGTNKRFLVNGSGVAWVPPLYGIFSSDFIGLNASGTANMAWLWQPLNGFIAFRSMTDAGGSITTRFVMEHDTGRSASTGMFGVAEFDAASATPMCIGNELIGGVNASTLASCEALAVTPIAVGSLPAAAGGNAGQWRTVNDSTAVTTAGQTCVGGGAVTAAAFSSGAVWKCF